MVRLNTVVIVMLLMMFLSAGVAGAAEIAGRLTNSSGTGIAGVVVTVYGQQQEAIQGTHRLTPLRFVCCRGDYLLVIESHITAA